MESGNRDVGPSLHPSRRGRYRPNRKKTIRWTGREDLHDQPASGPFCQGPDKTFPTVHHDSIRPRPMPFSKRESNATCLFAAVNRIFFTRPEKPEFESTEFDRVAFGQPDVVDKFVEISTEETSRSYSNTTVLRPKRLKFQRFAIDLDLVRRVDIRDSPLDFKITSSIYFLFRRISFLLLLLLLFRLGHRVTGDIRAD